MDTVLMYGQSSKSCVAITGFVEKVPGQLCPRKSARALLTLGYSRRIGQRARSPREAWIPSIARPRWNRSGNVAQATVCKLGPDTPRQLGAEASMRNGCHGSRRGREERVNSVE
jgi:hypothetical protein